MMTSITVSLPYPPSVNNLFVNNRKTGGRYPSDRYKTWRRAAQNMVTEQRVQWPAQSISGPVEVTMTFGRPDRRKRDLDNLMKAPLDTLVSMQIIEDDSKIQALTIRWGEVDGSLVEVRSA
jgi:crossover junction endodeoxyribonuclease RusA